MHLNVAAPVGHDADLTQLGVPLGEGLNVQVEPLADQELSPVADKNIGSAAGHRALGVARDLVPVPCSWMWSVGR